MNQTFVDQETLIRFAWYMAVLLPGIIIMAFFYIHNKVLENKNKEKEENNKNLMNTKHRSNGVEHKEK